MGPAVLAAGALRGLSAWASSGAQAACVAVTAVPTPKQGCSCLKASTSPLKTARTSSSELFPASAPPTALMRGETAAVPAARCTADGRVPSSVRLLRVSRPQLQHKSRALEVAKGRHR